MDGCNFCSCSSQFFDRIEFCGSNNRKKLNGQKFSGQIYFCYAVKQPIWSFFHLQSTAALITWRATVVFFHHTRNSLWNTLKSLKLILITSWAGLCDAGQNNKIWIVLLTFLSACPFVIMIFVRNNLCWKRLILC